ncbi:rCG42569 [Rattus norvegicus]|uniref:RCG42569 n=1 Tax=Rattus norvegicus TaxID=10116 RepID=A6K1V2_RAT|nr:rCG42569 [Rattus norvegicus]
MSVRAFPLSGNVPLSERRNACLTVGGPSHNMQADGIKAGGRKSLEKAGSRPPLSFLASMR